MINNEERPFRVTILAVFVLSITVWNVIRAWSAIANWTTLQEFGAPAAYILVSGLVWGVAGAWLTYALWSAKGAAFSGGLIVAGLYAAWYWFDRLFIQPSPAPNLLFSLVVSGVLAAIFIGGLFWAKAFLRSKARFRS